MNMISGANLCFLAGHDLKFTLRLLKVKDFDLLQRCVTHHILCSKYTSGLVQGMLDI